jgi:hypothetical protein
MRTRRARDAVAAVLAGGLMAVASPAIAHAQSPQSSDPTPPTSSSIHSVAAAPATAPLVENQRFYKYLVENQKSHKYFRACRRQHARRR